MKGAIASDIKVNCWANRIEAILDRTDEILKMVAEAVYEEEGIFFITLNAEDMDLPLEGTQRLVIGGKATPELEITDDGIEASLSINRTHYDVKIPWRHIFSIEGANQAYYCKRKVSEYDEGPGGKDDKGEKKKGGHLKVVK